jgi:hypothetical protein
MASGISHRQWFLWRADYDDDASFEAAIQSELVQLQFMCDRLGIAVIPSPVRDKLDRADGRPSEYFSMGWGFQTASIPAVREAAAEIAELEDALQVATEAE